MGRLQIQIPLVGVCHLPDDGRVSQTTNLPRPGRGSKTVFNLRLRVRLDLLTVDYDPMEPVRIFDGLQDMVQTVELLVDVRYARALVHEPGHSLGTSDVWS